MAIDLMKDYMVKMVGKTIWKEVYVLCRVWFDGGDSWQIWYHAFQSETKCWNSTEAVINILKVYATCLFLDKDREYLPICNNKNG